MPISQSPDAQRNDANDSALSEQVEAMNQAGSRIQQLVEQLETALDPAARAMFQECMESVLNFYGHGLRRVLQIASKPGENGRSVYDAIVQDTIVRSLLLIHDLHPSDLETRLREALNRVRPYLESHGGNVELVGLEGDFARLRLQGTCKGCASSTVTLELAIKNAIEEACPELSGFEVEGLPDAIRANADGSRASAGIRWAAVDEAWQLMPEQGMATRAGGVRLVVVRASNNFYAYRNICPACNMPLDPESLAGGTIACNLGHRYSVCEAGRSQGNSDLHLEPVPLLVQEQTVKVAIPRESEEQRIKS